MSSVAIIWMIDPNDAVVLFIRPPERAIPTGQGRGATDSSRALDRAAKVSYLARIPTFTTASMPDWPSGPLMPEIHQHNPDASRFQGLRIMKTRNTKLKRLNEKGRSACPDPKSISRWCYGSKPSTLLSQ